MFSEVITIQCGQHVRTHRHKHDSSWNATLQGCMDERVCLHICVYCSIAYGHAACISHQPCSWTAAEFKACLKLDWRKWKDFSREEKKKKSVCTRADVLCILSTMMTLKAQRRWRLPWTTQDKTGLLISRTLRIHLDKIRRHVNCPHPDKLCEVKLACNTWKTLKQLCYCFRLCFGHPPYEWTGPLSIWTWTQISSCGIHYHLYCLFC